MRDDRSVTSARMVTLRFYCCASLHFAFCLFDFAIPLPASRRDPCGVANNSANCKIEKAKGKVRRKVTMNLPTYDDVVAAAPVVHRYLPPTPLYEYPALSALLGCRFLLK